MQNNNNERTILYKCESCKKELTQKQIEVCILDKFPFVCDNCGAFLIEQMKICIPLMQKLKF